MDRFIQRSVVALFIIALLGNACAQIAITEYVNDTNGDGASAAGAGEWVELYNYSDSAVTLSGWRMKDDATNNAVIPTMTIQPKDFLLCVRNKAAIEKMWFGGAVNSRVVQYASGTFQLSDTGSDELVLTNASNVVIWRLAYPALPAEGTNTGASTYYAGTDFSVINHGTVASPINRNGNDPLTGALGYQGQEFTADPVAFGSGGDVGSPLRGAYPGANNPPAQPTSWVLNVSGPGTALSAGVRGLAIADQTLDRHDNSDQTGIIPSLETARGSATRGVAGGLYADMYDWKRRNDQPRPTTLQFLRWARDYNCELYVTANVRGLVEWDPFAPPGYRRYYTTETLPLVNMAKDWVRYTNHICQTYHEGDTINDPRDATIMSELTWNSEYVNEFGTADRWTTLPAVGETVPKVTYWEIGNEPLVSLANAYSVTNGFTFSGTAGNAPMQEWVDRYIAITTAMLAEDPTIKVGPCIVSARTGNNTTILDLLLQSGAQVDFISYHPYGSMGDFWQIPGAWDFEQAYLSGVHSEQWVFLRDIKAVVAARRPSQVSTMEYIASETNVSDFRTNNTYQEASMAHALGCVESIFSWARLGLRAAHYWIWITGPTVGTDPASRDWARFPATMAFEKMRDVPLGDRLLGSFDANDKLRVHVAKDTATGTIQVWAMNFSNSTDIPFNLSLTGGPTAQTSIVRKTVLQAITGPTRLWSVNLNPEMNSWVPRRDVDWTEPERLFHADPANLNLTLPAATLTLLTVEPFNPAAAAWWELYE